MLAAMVDEDGGRDGQPEALTMTDSGGSRFDPSLSPYQSFVRTWVSAFEVWNYSTCGESSFSFLHQTVTTCSHMCPTPYQAGFSTLIQVENPRWVPTIHPPMPKLEFRSECGGR